MSIYDYQLLSTYNPKHTLYFRWYRAPEIMLNSKAYDKHIDVWSVGCIMGEMITGKPMFPGENYLEQINLIFDVLGTPTETDCIWIQNKNARRYVSALPKTLKKPRQQLYPNWTNKIAMDLLDDLLTFDPHKRITVDQTLEHEYFEQYHEPEDEPTCPEPLKLDLEFDNTPTEMLKNLIMDEARKFADNDIKM